jgi:glycine/D-amino acid oxidase-like deaminating enzyme
MNVSVKSPNTPRHRPTIAVLGAGLTGALTALELADDGYRVLLLDRRPMAMAGASLGNEGKIHLGYVYAMDSGLKTARMMIEGAVDFRPLVARWTGESLFDASLSDPFLYAVPKDSMLNVSAIRAHFAEVSRMIRDRHAGDAVTKADPDWEEMSASDCAAIFQPREITTAFRTGERAIRPEAIAKVLREALDAAPLIETHYATEVSSLAENGAGYVITARGPAGDLRFTCDQLVNALWEERVHFDAMLGLAPARPVIHRYKAGLVSNDPRAREGLPNVTFLVGRYGDAVSYDNTTYVSWYPAGLLAQEISLRPRRVDPLEPGTEAHQRLVNETLGNLRRLMPSAVGLAAQGTDWTVKGGYITAWGETGIEQPDSELHRRYDVGVHSNRGHHSVDTGKLTLAPRFAAEVCARIRG